MNAQTVTGTVIALFACLAHGLTAVASLVAWEFAGEITSVYDENDLLGGRVSIGTPFSGSYTFDPRTYDLATSTPNVGFYPAITHFSGEVAGMSFVGPLTSANMISVRNGSAALLSDGYGLGVVAELLGERVSVRLGFTDDSGTVFDSDALPVDPLDLSAFDRAVFHVQTGEELPLMIFDGDITSLVPEPTTLALLVLGGAAMFGRTRRRTVLVSRAIEELS